MSVAQARPARDRLAGQREQTAATVQSRQMQVMLLFGVATLIIVVRVFWLWIASDRPSAGNPGARLLPPRADIVDRNGAVLAGTIDSWKIAVHPRKVIGDRAAIAARLAELMPERNASDYLAILNSGRSFYYLRHEALPELVQAVNAIGEPALVFERETRRYYPQGQLAAHLLGWTDRDGKAASGLELAFDKRLLDPAQRNRPLMLSIDSRVQAAVEAELAQAVATFSAAAATGIVLDVHSGELIALASLPTFDPNNPARVPVENLYNRATLSVYELGSTFKMITVANAIENGVIRSMGQRYDATAPLKVGRFTIRDFHPEKRVLTVPEVLIHSSNIATARIADDLGRGHTEAMFRKLGFNRTVDLELGARGTPLYPKYWARVTNMTVAYGHGIAVTPLHLANAYAALVNGGVARPATLLKRMPDQIPGGTRVISPETSAKMRQLMRLVVTDGSGGKANVAGFRVGGKTGTAEKPGEGGYKRNMRVSTFAAAFPMDAPRYVVIVMLDEPSGTAATGGYATAGMVSAPTAGKIIARAGPLLGVIPDDRREIDLGDLPGLIWKPEAERQE